MAKLEFCSNEKCARCGGRVALGDLCSHCERVLKDRWIDFVKEFKEELK